jgi:hypothetical protein
LELSSFSLANAGPRYLKNLIQIPLSKIIFMLEKFSAFDSYLHLEIGVESFCEKCFTSNQIIDLKKNSNNKR